MGKYVYGGVGLLLGVFITVAAFHVGDAPSTATAQLNTDQNPAYMIVTGTVHDRAAFMAGYAAHLGPLYARHGGHYLALGANPEVLEGQADQSFVVSKWPSAEAARAFWNDPEYERLKQARIEQGWGTFNVILVDGLPEPAQSNPALIERDPNK